MPGTAAFPTDIDQISEEWLTGTLHADGAIAQDVSVTGYEAEFLSDGVGQTGVVARLRLDYTGGTGPETVVVKYATGDATRRKAAVMAQLYSREVSFYAKIAPHVDLRSPHAYFAAIDANEEFFLLVLEDFPGHIPGDQVAGSSRQDAEIAMRQMARLHAPYWEKDIPVPIEEQQLPPQTLFADGWDELERTYGDYMSSELKALRDPLLTSLDPLLRWKFASPATLTHGDFKADNLLLGDRDGPDPIVALDWQAMGRNKSMLDVAYYITHNMAVEERRACELALIDAYLEELRSYGVDYVRDDALADYRIALAYLLLYLIFICGVNVIDHPRAIERKRRLNERVSASTADWRLGEILPLK